MTITKIQHELFLTGNDFDQINFLDDFYENINISKESGDSLTGLLLVAIKADNNYIKRSAFKILCDLALALKTINSFAVLNELQTFLLSDEPTLKVIAIKYLPYFSEGRVDFIMDQLKELSDSNNGDVASQSYFCLGIFQLTEAVSLSNIEDTITSLSKAKIHFQAAILSTENRVDAEFYLFLIDWLESLISCNSELIQSRFDQIEKNLLLRNFYGFGNKGLELDFLIFQLANQIRLNLQTSSSVDTWLDIKVNIKVLLQVNEEILKIKNSTITNKFLLDRLFSNVFQNIENEIYQTHLSSNKKRLELLKAQESEVTIVNFLDKLITQLPENGKGNQGNLELLAVLSEVAGADDGLALYNRITDKNGSSEVLNTIRDLCLKHTNHTQPYRTGSIYGQEVFNTLKEEILNSLPNYPTNKLEAFLDVLEEVIRYARTGFVKNDRKRFSFLYTEKLNGKGQNALEQDLQDSMLSFLEHSKISDGIEHEKARFVDGGRVDILYIKDLITIPIELKKSLKRPSKSNLEDNYIAQAQTYTSGYDQLGIFVLLELSDKKNDPQPNFKDWFKIHHLTPSTNLDLKYPDYVVSVVIPGNRNSPSSKSNYK